MSLYRVGTKVVMTEEIVKRNGFSTNVATIREIELCDHIASFDLHIEGEDNAGPRWLSHDFIAYAK